jgi:4-amino-4-deoxy-L-arabinose transferase-like glycosyltransferase
MKIEDIAFLVSIIIAVLLSISIYFLTNDLFKSVAISAMISVIVGTLILLKGEEK